MKMTLELVRTVDAVTWHRPRRSLRATKIIKRRNLMMIEDYLIDNARCERYDNVLAERVVNERTVAMAENAC